MRHAIVLIAPSLVLACGSGNASNAALEAALANTLAQSGVQCAPREPPSVQACAGKKAGDACEEIDDEGSESGTCQAIPDGRLVCDDDDRDGGEGAHHRRGDAGLRPPPAPLTDACSRKAAGAACMVAFQNASFSGSCKAVAGFNVCLPPAEPPPPPITACAGKTAGAACSVAFGGRSFAGDCRLLGDHGVVACVPPLPPPPPDHACDGKKPGDACHDALQGVQFVGACHALAVGMRCLPHPPPPPAAAVDACVDRKRQDACSFSFRDHQFTGACVAAANGTVVCAPVCH